LRSQIAHEGVALHTRFVVPSASGKGDNTLYHSILVFGRQIFQTCLSAILFGEHLARKTDVTGKLVTNAERFLSICKVLADSGASCLEKLRSVEPTVADLDKYRYVDETGLEIDRLVGAVRLMCKCLLETGQTLRMFSREDLEAAASSKDNFATLEVIDRLKRSIPRQTFETATEEERTAHVLCDVVWHYTFQHFFWLKREQEQSRIGAVSQPEGTDPAPL
jgi:hypothetical protein